MNPIFSLFRVKVVGSS